MEELIPNEETALVEETKNKKTTIWDIIYYIMIIGSTTAISVILIFYASPGTVIGHSMDNTLADKDINIIDKRAYKSSKPQYKDIVVFKTNIDGGKYLVKRVIGTGGDVVGIINDKLYINGELIQENYIKEPMRGTADIIMKIPEGMVFVMGDNRNNSLDSRSEVVGLVDYKRDILGKAVYRIYPLDTFGRLEV